LFGEVSRLIFRQHHDSAVTLHCPPL
jgi:hypothetical protein